MPTLTRSNYFMDESVLFCKGFIIGCRIRTQYRFFMNEVAKDLVDLSRRDSSMSHQLRENTTISIISTTMDTCSLRCHVSWQILHVFMIYGVQCHLVCLFHFPKYKCHHFQRCLSMCYDQENVKNSRFYVSNRKRLIHESLIHLRFWTTTYLYSQPSFQNI